MTKKQMFTIGMLVLAVLGFTSVERFGTTPYHFSYPANFGNRIFVPSTNPTTVEGVELGRRLFYDTRLSINNRVSCASCHKQSHAFADTVQFNTGVNGELTDRNSMSLVNLLWVRNLFWDGRASGLEAQAEFPISHPREMGGTMMGSAAALGRIQEYPQLFEKAFSSPAITPDLIARALAQFQRTLISANSKYDLYLRGEYNPTVDELAGISLFYTNPVASKGIRGAACAQCHGGPKTFTELFHNNGLDRVPVDVGRQLITNQEIDRGRFRVVTLRNIALTAPYMHDGRFKTLEQVVDHYSDSVITGPNVSPFLNDNHASRLTQKEKKQLVLFLNLLTDSIFVNNKQFSNPFNQ